MTSHRALRAGCLPLYPRLRLSAAGRALVLAAALLLVGGVLAESWAVVLWGQGMAALLVLGRGLARGPLCSLRDGHLLVDVRLPPARSRPPLVVGRAMPLELVFDSPLRRALHVVARLRTSMGLVPSDSGPAERCTTLRHGEQRLPCPLTPLRLGPAWVQGVELRLFCGLDLFVAEGYAPVELCVQVRSSRPSARTIASGRLRQPPTDRAGAHRLPQAGLGSEFKELREHQPGDPFRLIEWKATARHQQLMVRELEREQVLSLWVLLDVSPSMRRGPVGSTPLDRAIGLIQDLARSVLALHDRIGLMTFDQRVVGELVPASGGPQQRRLADHLAELFQLVDQDLTEPTPEELLEAFSGALRERFGVTPGASSADKELTRLLDWLEGPLGPRGLPRGGRLRRRSPDQGHIAARIRRLCRSLGVPLSYRAREAPGELERGLAEALALAGAQSHAGHHLLILSDLDDEGAGQVLSRSLRVARAHCLRVAALHAAGPGLLDAAQPRSVTQDLLARDESSRGPVLRLLAAQGVAALPWERWANGPRLHRFLRESGARRAGRRSRHAARRSA